MRQPCIAVVVIALVVTGCVNSPTGVVLAPDEKVIGRARDLQRVRLLTTAGRLVTVWLSDLSTASERVMGLTQDDHAWGLAVSADGKWWTLVGASQLGEIDDRGHVAGRVPLGTSYVGLFGVGGAILLQPATLVAGQPVLQRLELETMARRNSGSLRSKSFDTRAETLALNLVACGSTQIAELPCWFSHGRLVDRVTLTGPGRQQDLAGLGLAVDDASGLDRIEMSGPIIDAHIDALGRLWVLLRRPTESGGETSVVARYAESGALDGLVTVSGQSRMILDVRDRRSVLLVGGGQFSTVSIP